MDDLATDKKPPSKSLLLFIVDSSGGAVDIESALIQCVVLIGDLMDHESILDTKH